ncbi:phospholipase D-like domain-containing protein [Paenibacillus sp. 11B]|uniref:phospholipase D-like domain-containing protein n=1 Tax=Paenibacillus sp. 11B TaxID=3060965 RepID=UPI002650AD26|nr:phospholipase D-like domain-containing protein [Paenibacillus sp. 11B]MDN8593172.1 phospholipase D-like domain-containing protein [Paenibacillus sp. 11B]
MFIRSKGVLALGLLFFLSAGCSSTDSFDRVSTLFTSSFSDPEQSVSIQSSNIEYAFTQKDQHPEKLLIQVIDDAQDTLDISIYSLTERNITNSIINAHQRGVKVRVITDRSQSEGESQAKRIHQLLDEGIEVKENTHSGLMHHKTTIADRSVTTTGSFNYSAAATKYNDEVLVVIHDKAIAEYWSDVFQEMWLDQERYAAISL